MLDPWLPVGYQLPQGIVSERPVYQGIDWQIVATAGGGKALLADEGLARRWIESRLVNEGGFAPLQLSNKQVRILSAGPSQIVAPVVDAPSLLNKSEGLAFAQSLSASRALDPDSPFQDGIYVEKISRILPTYDISTETPDDVVLGYWLTGGLPVSVRSFRRLHGILSRWDASDLRDVVEAAGFEVSGITVDRPRPRIESRPGIADDSASGPYEVGEKGSQREFALPGRPNLAAFFNEHVVDVVLNPDRYQALGITFPSAIVLHGPPGTGKTFAVQRLVEFLGWPSFEIDASSVASPYIHETSRKVASVFDEAMASSPSVLVIDEMEAFLAQRDMAGGHPRVEEVAEFLRRIPEAGMNQVLVIAMTNRIDMVDEAVLRRGRFDHIIEVGFAGEEEILELLRAALSELPVSEDVSPEVVAGQLRDRPLSDVAFVVREGARLAARAGKRLLDQESLQDAMAEASARGTSETSERRIGFS